jgi:hypothetical protein
MKKLLLLIAGLSLPWTVFADDDNVIFRNNDGQMTGSMRANPDGSWTYQNNEGQINGSARPNPQGGWTFYNRDGQIVGSEDGQ